jgi:hypothetical protein
VTAPASMYDAGRHRRTVVCVAVRCRQANGRWGVGVLISTLAAADALRLTGHPPAQETDPVTCLLAYVHLYDQRGGAWRRPSRRTSRAWG